MTATENQPLLSVAGLVVRYGVRTAVDGVDFDIQRGETLGLLGPNGAGKTTTLSVIEGLRKPNAGSVTIDGIDALDDRADVRSKLGVQLQSSSFQPELSLSQILRLYAGLYGLRMSRVASTRNRGVRSGFESRTLPATAEASC